MVLKSFGYKSFLLFVILAIALLLLFSCKKEHPKPSPPRTETQTVELLCDTFSYRYKAFVFAP
jgi:hypothetical protein